MSTKEELIKQAELVRDAKIVGENTAYRVGSLLLDIVNMLGTSGNTSIPDMSKYLPRSEFDEMFAWATQGSQRFIDAKATVASRGSIAALYAGEPLDIPTYITSEMLEARLKELNVGVGGLDMEALQSYLTNNSYATQDWVKRQGFLTGITGYLPLTGGTLSDALTIQCGADTKLAFNNTDGEKYSAIKFLESGTEYSRMIGYEHKFEFSKYIEAPKFVAQTSELCQNVNADLLDGVHLSSLVRYNSSLTTSSDHIYRALGYGYPDRDNVWIVPGPAVGFGVANYHALLQSPYNGENLYFKACVNGTYTDWSKVVLSDLNGKISSIAEIDMTGGIVSGGRTNGCYMGAAATGLGANYAGGLLYAYGGNPLYFYTSNKERLRIDQFGQIYQTVDPSAIWSASKNCFSPSLGATQRLVSRLGKSASNYNTGYMCYYHTGDGNPNNLLTLGFWGNDDILSISASGRVGILLGPTTSPQYTLDVNGDIRSNSVIRSHIPTIDSYNFQFNNETLGITGGMGTSLRGDGIQGAYLWLTGEKNSWRFATNGTARMIIDPNGKVGFGTLTPQFDVDVNGDICIRTGRIYLTPSVWIEYDAANDVIRSNRTFVSKGDIGALTT